MRRLNTEGTRDVCKRACNRAWSVAVCTAGAVFFSAGAAQSLHGAESAPEPVFSVDSGVFTNATITFSVAAPQGVVRYTFDGSVPTESSTPYSGPITVGTNTVIKARTFATGIEPGPVVSRVYQFLDASAAAFNSELPIVILSTAGKSIPMDVPPGQPRVPGSLVVIDTFRGRSSIQSRAQFIGLAEYEIFGQTAAGFPKRPYTIEIQDEYRNDRAVPLLGMPAEADWKLRGLYNDKSLINEALAFELFDQMGHYTVRRRFVEVFVDTSGGRIAYPQDYVGVMMLLEKIEIGPGRVPISKLKPSDAAEPDIAGGYIWKKEKDSVGDLNFSTGRYSFKVHEPKPREITAPQFRWLTNHVRQFEAALYAANWLTATGTNHYSHYIDVDSFVDQHWIVEFTKNIDGYRLGNFMRKDRGGKIQMDLLWDWELSFGNANYLQGGLTNGWYFPQLGAGDHVWLRRLIGGGGAGGPWSGPGDPDFVQRIIDRWGELRTNALSAARILSRVDELAGQLGEAAARDNAKFPRLGTYVWPNPNGAGKNGDSFAPEGWHVDYVTPTTHAGIISELKKWIAGRCAWLDRQFLRAPVFNHPGGVVPRGFNVVVGAPGSTTYYTLDGTDPRASGGGVSPAAQTALPIMVNENVQIFARAHSGAGMTNWSPAAIATFIAKPSPLRVTELMYHPPPSPPNAEGDQEYIELRNTGTAPLRVGGCRLTGAVEFNFPDSILAAGEYVLVVKNRSAFSPSLPVIGEYAGDLSNDGERIILQGRLGEVILDFSYDDRWYPATDGHGFSLVIADDSLAPASWGIASSWRSSGRLGGSPGMGESTPPAIANVVISEALARAVPPNENAVEVQNLSSQSVDLGGWYLTDDPDHPRKFRITENTVVLPGAFRVFTESDFVSPGADGALTLSRTGGRLFLFSGDATGELTGYANGAEFGAQESGVSFGRHITSEGEAHFVAQSTVTLGGTNAAPRVGPVIISEIMYRPLEVPANGRFWDNVEDEYIELFNAGAASVSLSDPARPANGWKLAGAVDFQFPTDTVIPPGGFLVVVSFDPDGEPARLAALRAAYGVSSATAVIGPWSGSLRNDSATVVLLKPDAAIEEGSNAGSVPDVLVEQVSCSSSSPWPTAADGAGFSLNRGDEETYADDPANWIAAAPTPGGPYLPAAPPSIVSQPQSLNAVTFEAATLAVGVEGTGPFRYQWRRNGVILNTETNASLVISSAQPSHAGVYQVLVLNKTGAVLSSEAVVKVLVKVAITEHPRSVTAPAGSNAAFVVTAESVYPIRYQWRLNGTNLPGAIDRVLSLSNITNVHDGTYTVVCTDDVGSVVSQPAQLTVRLRAILVAPTPPVHLTAVAGDTVTLGVQVLGDLPIYCRWRLFRSSGGQIISNQLLTTRTTFVTIPVSATNAGAYTVILSNATWGFLNTAYTNAFLTVLADTDGDRIPDEFEDANQLNRLDPSDGAPDADADDDGSSNRSEYLAGTDPQDPNSFLRVQTVLSGGARTLQFGAAADRTYTIQYSDALSPGQWRKVADVLAGASRVETVIDPAPNAEARFYRVVTPRQP